MNDKPAPQKNTTLSFDNTEIAFSHLSDTELTKANMLFRAIDSNFLVKIGPPLTLFALNIGLPITGLIRSTIFAHFCGGESIEDSTKTIKHLAEYKVGTILDYSVEGEHNEHAFDACCREVIATVARAGRDKHVPFSVFKLTGLGRFALLEKVQQKTVLSKEETDEWFRVQSRVDMICHAAFQAHIPVMIDAEESWIQGTIDEVALQMMAKYNKLQPIVYNTYQFYRHETLAFLRDSIKGAEQGNYFIGAKLVRGAYMEKERARAQELNYTDPIQADKASCDRDYNAALKYCIEHIDRVMILAGTHNEDSCRVLVNLMEQHGIAHNDSRVYFSQLLGMSDNLSFNLSHANYNVAKYVPYGPVKSVLPYLFRRANENTSISGQMGRELSLIVKEQRRRKKK